MVQQSPTNDSSKKKRPQFLLVLFRYYRLLTAVIVVAIILGSYFFILKPKYEQVGVGGRYNVSSLRAEFESRQKYLTALLQLNENYQALNKSDVDRLEKILPAERDIPGLLAQLEDMAVSQGVLISGISFSDTPEPGAAQQRRFGGQAEPKDQTGDGISKLTIDFNLLADPLGQYRTVKNFLSALESNMRLFDVNAVYFTPGTGEFSISMFTYYVEESDRQ